MSSAMSGTRTSWFIRRSSLRSPRAVGPSGVCWSSSSIRTALSSSDKTLLRKIRRLSRSAGVASLFAPCNAPAIVTRLVLQHGVEHPRPPSHSSILLREEHRCAGVLPRAPEAAQPLVHPPP
eukprot:CAMPEP_0180362292 /NCGR_PEP_ID=MMETSP0989-20121125/13228_1 /TAXON_ID=697907 /ORGANISM="non described non described, Strain CCMP2293" /LENGTH=121 /DNA_ID=CAMNT_0022354279 /DNA_START=385 /DNA_END=750 /DNA_ORIENTATION=-